MNVEFAFICDYADAGTKISALGIGFDTIMAREVPVTHPHFHLVAQFRASVAETGEKELVIRLIDADGADVMSPVTVKINVSPPPQGLTESVARMAIGVNGVRFNKFGQYALHVVMQGQEIIRIPLRVIQGPVGTMRQPGA
ncbi:MAG: hypothetical protein V3V35_10740 [Dehalococcoidia bacterium]